VTILCDVDGVCADLLSEWLGRYNSDYGDTVTPEQVSAWDVSKFVKPECGKKIFGYLHLPELYEAVQPIRGAWRGLRTLEEVGHRVIFITTCVGPEMVVAKLGWLNAHDFLLDTHGKLRPVLFLDDATPKRVLRGDVLIDDYDKNLRDFGGRGVLLDCAYNRHDETFTRACGWNEVVNAIMENASETATAATK
jgi:5'-nucleotidase